MRGGDEAAFGLELERLVAGNRRPNGSEGTKRAMENSHGDCYYTAVT